jgi:hypothetical protein
MGNFRIFAPNKDAMLRPHPIIGALVCLSLFLSCQEKGETVLPFKMVSVADDQFYPVEQFFPELATSPSIQYDEEMGYYIPFGEKEWSRSMSVDPVSIPAQSCSFDFDALRFEADDFSGWVIENTTREVLLQGIPENLDWGECPSVFKMTISLGEDAPYRKVTLSDLIVTFPPSFTAHAQGAGYSIPKLEVTPEGAVVSFDLAAIGLSDLLVNRDGELCCSLPTRFFALVSLSPEEAVGPVPDRLSFHCTFQFDRIDFTECHMFFPDLFFPADELVWDAVPLPSFLCGEGSDVTLTHFRVLFDYRNNFPPGETYGIVTRVNAVARSGEREAAFSAEGEAINYMFMAQMLSNYHEGYFNQDIPALGELIRSPFPGGAVQPSLELQPVWEKSGYVVPGTEYQVSAQVDLKLPLAFTGQLHVDSFQTPPLVMEGSRLKAPAHSTHRIEQKIGSNLPFDCRVTPVFTMEGKPPVFLEEFILDKDAYKYSEDFNGYSLSYVFTPEKDDWKATLYYIVTPTQGTGEVFFRSYNGLVIVKSFFSSNVRSAQ